MARSVSIALVVLGACAFGEPVAVDGGVDDGAVIDAADAAIDAPVDAGCVDQPLAVLDNADFEGGNTIWTETTNGAQMVIREVGAGFPFDPEGGSWGALIGGFNDAVIELSQTVSVPADATALKLSGYRCWVTDEAAGAGDLDLLTIELRDDGGAALESLLAISNEDAGATCAWERFEIGAAQTNAGASIALVFEGTTDGATVTSFAFDTLALEATVCR